jgi:hypothetical protein
MIDVPDFMLSGPDAAPPAMAPSEPPPFVPGAFPDMPSETYHAIEALSNGGGVKLRKSQADYKLMRTEKKAPTDAMIFGTAVHMALLEPARFETDVVIAPIVNPYTKAGKEEKAAFALANASKVILTVEAYRRALACAASVRAHPGASKLLQGAVTELSLFWVDKQYDIPCKCRFDLISHGGGTDLKTTLDASPEGFAKSVANYEYHAQGAHYMSGAEHCLNETPRFFGFIAVESQPPHLTGCYFLPSAAIRAGQRLMAIAAERYAEGLKTGVWRGYADTIEELHLPRWALRFDE